MTDSVTELTIPLRSHDEAVLVLGPYDRHAKLLRQELDIELYTRRGNLRLRGHHHGVQEARQRIEHLLGKSRKGRELSLRDIETILGGRPRGDAPAAASGPAGPRQPKPEPSRAPRPEQRVHIQGKMRGVEPRTDMQRKYLELMSKKDLVLGLGPAGTGKTYLAVAAAVRALRTGDCRRLVITRPVVEAGERLGFLPGDLADKLNPYMRPIYDALYDLLDFEEVGRLEEAGIIEVAPLAYMRGRTLAASFVILDEGQNTTIPQMKMFLTRMGEDSRMVVTGDPSQNDLEPNQRSGLIDAVQRLRSFQDIGIVEFSARDIVRHPLVEQIVRAYQGPSKVVRAEEEEESA